MAFKIAMCSDKAFDARLGSFAATRCRIRIKVHNDSKANTINWFSQESTHNLCRFVSSSSAFPINIEFLIMARLVGGIGVGVASMATPIYIAEIAPPGIRGKLVSINQVAIIIGMVMAYTANRYIIDLGNEDWMNNLGWRWMFATEMVPAVLYLLLLYFIVESPRWLAKSQKLERAQLVLQKITRPGSVEATYSAILNNLKEEEGSVGELFRPKRRRITIMAMILALFQAITGINVIMYYAPRIFLTAGIATGDAYGHSIIIGLVMLVFTLVSLFLVDRIGRRLLLLVASFGMGISLILLGLALSNCNSMIQMKNSLPKGFIFSGPKGLLHLWSDF